MFWTSLEVVVQDEQDGNACSGDALFSGIAEKLRSGALLDDYELHIMLDVVLLHVRLGARRQSTA